MYVFVVLNDNFLIYFLIRCLASLGAGGVGALVLEVLFELYSGLREQLHIIICVIE